MTLHRNRGLQTRVESTCAPPSWPVSSKRLYSGVLVPWAALPPPRTPTHPITHPFPLSFHTPPSVPSPTPRKASPRTMLSDSDPTWGSAPGSCTDPVPRTGLDPEGFGVLPAAQGRGQEGAGGSLCGLDHRPHSAPEGGLPGWDRVRIHRVFHRPARSPGTTWTAGKA